MRRVTFAAPLLLALALAPGRAHAQAYAPEGTRGTVEYDEGAWGVTVCGTHPVTWYSNEMPDSARGMVEAHEAEHRRFMASFASCREFNEWKRASVEHVIIAEARAFCAGARYERLRGRHASLMEAVWAQAKVFRHYFIAWGPEDAASAIYRYCG